MRVLQDHINRVCDTTATVYRRERDQWRFGSSIVDPSAPFVGETPSMHDSSESGPVESVEGHHEV
jgi:hypothetical protein